MEWIPSWLARPYALLYRRKGIDWATFEEITTLLLEKEKRKVSLILSELERKGFLWSKRESVDRRRRLFRVLKPADVVFAYAIQSRVRDKGLIPRLKAASRFLSFVIGGSYAAYNFHNYMTPGKVDVYVREQDVDRWLALLADRYISVSLDEILAEERRREIVHLHSEIDPETMLEVVTLDGLRYLSPDEIITRGLANQGELSLIDSVAILIHRRSTLNWTALLRKVLEENCVRELGCLLDIVNFEAKRTVFPHRIISDLSAKVRRSSPKLFPSGSKETPEYIKFGRKWNLKIGLSRGLISKVVSDLL